MTAQTAAEVLTTHQATSTSGCHCGGVRLGESFPQHQVDMLAAAGFTLAARGDAAPTVTAEQRERLIALTYESDDGTEYEHVHTPGWGEPGCPACWAESIRRALGVLPW